MAAPLEVMLLTSMLLKFGFIFFLFFESDFPTTKIQWSVENTVFQCLLFSKIKSLIDNKKSNRTSYCNFSVLDVDNFIFHTIGNNIKTETSHTACETIKVTKFLLYL